MTATNVVHLPKPQSFDMDVIAHGRFRALRQYQDARSDAERYQALIWVNHWRTLWEHAKALRTGLSA